MTIWNPARAWLVCVALLLLSSGALAAADPEINIQMTVLAEGIYQFTTAADGYVEQLNTVVVVNERDVLVFDTNTRPSSARHILAEIRRITDKPVRYVVNSHWHPDHWSGNEVFLEAFPNADIIATADALHYMRYAAPPWPARFHRNYQQAQADFDKERDTGKHADGTALDPGELAKDENNIALYRSFVEESDRVHRTYPNLIYEDKLTLQRGGREFQFLSMTGDAQGTTVMYLPKEKIVCTGDLVVMPVPYGGPTPGKTLKSLRDLAKMDIATLVPGHGPALHDLSYVKLEIATLESVIGQVQQALANGAANLETLKKAANVDEFRTKFTHGDKSLDDNFNNYVQGLIARSVREAREQDYTY